MTKPDEFPKDETIGASLSGAHRYDQPHFVAPQSPTDIRHFEWRAILDRLDLPLIESGAMDDPALFDARRALGKAIGCLLESAEAGHRVNVTARTFPPYGENGPLRRELDRPTPAQVLKETLDDVRRLSWYLGVCKNDVAMRLDSMEQRLTAALATTPLP